MQVKNYRRSEIAAAMAYLYFMRGHSFDPDAMPRSVLAKLLGIEPHRVGRAIADARETLRLATLLNNKLESYDGKPKRVGRPAGSKNRTPEEIEAARKKRLPIQDHIAKMHKANKERLERERAMADEENKHRTRLRIGTMTDGDAKPRTKGNRNPNMSEAAYPTP